MKKLRSLLPPLLLGLFLAGCVMRPAPAAVPEPEPTPAAVSAVTPEPAAVPAATPVPEPTPEPEPTPSPAPTPCPHYLWVDGACAACGQTCGHPGWSGGRCIVCGVHCTHPSHDAQTLVCSQCGETVAHEFLGGVCDLCGMAPTFTHNVLSQNMFRHAAPAGTVVSLSYLTHDYYEEGQTWGYVPLRKNMVVYLPAGYDPSEKYDVMVLVHGMGETETYWLQDGQKIVMVEGANPVYTVDLLNWLMDTGYCRKMIIACPCFYRDGSSQWDFQRQRDEEQFLLELQNDIVPFLVDTYSTYALSSSREDIAAAREHFAYAGLSLGSIYAFTSVMPNCLDMFGWFGCFSGSEADMNKLVSALNAPENAAYPIYYFYNSAGGSDAMYALHRDQYRELVAAVDSLTDGENAAFTEIYMAGHSYPAWGTGLYNFLRVVFAQPEE